MKKTWLIVLIFAATVCFSHLSQGTLAVDAIRYGYISKTINDTGDWLTLHDPATNTQYTNKPPLLFWLTALSMKTLGFSTFSAKLPSVFFVFLFLLLVWHAANRRHGELSGLLALLLITANRNFGRNLLDLNLEGIAAFGAMLCLCSLFPIITSAEKRNIGAWAGFASGIFFLLLSKPPYVLLVLLPLFLTVVHSRKLVVFIKNPFCLLAGILPFGIMFAYYAVTNFFYLQNSIDNQFAEPLRVSTGIGENLLGWAEAIFLSFAPMSLLGLVAVRKKLKLWSKLESYDALLLFWLSPALIIIAMVACRDRYLLVPMLALNLLAAEQAACWLKSRAIPYFRLLLLVTSLLMFLLFSLYKVPIHRAHPLITATKENPAYLQQDPVFCLDWDREYRSIRKAQSSILLFDMEFGVKPPVFYSGNLPLEKYQGKVVLANDLCVQALRQREVPFEILRPGRDASWLKLASNDSNL